jgi:uncharacterized FAD-dependent dehydrogenase
MRSTTSENVLFQKEWDVLIVGAGPAGLFASIAIASSTSLKVLLIDKGDDVNERQRSWIQELESSEQRYSYVTGVGGAGLYSDGKLCFSLNVGGSLKETLSPAKKQQLLRVIATHLGLPNEFREMEVASESAVRRIEKIADEAGLEFKYYPVLQIGTERCSSLISHLRDRLQELGVTLIPNCSLLDLWKDSKSGAMQAIIESDNAHRTIVANQVVLALGKVGSDLESRLCERLGVPITRRPMYVGVRVEADAADLEPLFAIARDPKFSMRFGDGSKIKTHCASNQGQVMALAYDGLPVAGGQNFHALKTGRSGFSIVWDGLNFEGQSYDIARSLMSKIAEFTEGKLLAQTLADYTSDRSSTAASFDHINLSNRIYAAGNIRAFLPAEFFAKFDEFLNRLARLAPGIRGNQTVLYAPAIEWWMNRIEVTNGTMETNCKGLYVCGDGSGWSQGIIHAAATGLLAAEGIAATSASFLQQVPAASCA